MGILRSFEERIENIFEGFFSRFKAGIQPIEIARKITKEMDTHKTISISRVYAPNIYTIFLNKEDYKNLEPFQSNFNHELKELIKTKALEKKYSLVGETKIFYKIGDNLKIGQFRLETSLSEIEPKEEEQKEEPEDKTQIINKEVIEEMEPSAWLELKGKQKNIIPLITEEFKIGRLPENNLVLDDPNVSRVHAIIYNDPLGQYWLKDLNSTNGVFVNGEKIARKKLADRDVVAIGNVIISFRHK